MSRQRKRAACAKVLGWKDTFLVLGDERQPVLVEHSVRAEMWGGLGRVNGLAQMGLLGPVEIIILNRETMAGGLEG